MSVYDLSYLGAPDNRVTFNGTSFPLFRVVSRAPQARQFRQEDEPIPFEDGITDYLTLESGSNYVIQGVMYPGSEADYDNGLAALRKLASLDISQDDNTTDMGYVPYIYTEYNQTKQIFMKVMYVDVPETTRKGLVQPFRLFCKVKNPMIFGTSILTASTQGSNPTNNGGSALFPVGFPLLIGASTYSVSSVATNSGDSEGYPITIKVYGPINNPTITNAATGEYITVNTNILLNSILTIAYDADSLSVDVDGVSVLSNVSASFFKLQPGANNITLNGSSFSSGAYVALAYYSGYWPLS